MQSLITEAPQVSRMLRNPTHRFNVRHAPYVIQPFLIAPVLPGETMKNLSIQARALTQPITNPLIGWWIEYYIFYVKHRDLADSADLQALMLDRSATLTGASGYRSSATDRWSYFKGTGYDFVKECAKVCIENYFRDEGEAWNVATIDSNPAAYLEGNDFTHSLMTTTAEQTTNDVTIQTTETEGVPNIVTLSARDVQSAMDQYFFLRQTGMTNASYEDFLRSYGVRTQQIVTTKPELLRYIREWSYPSSHVQPNATTPSLSDVTSAVSWSIAERADKERYFKEPGFIFGMTCCRPKVYSSWQQAAAVRGLDDAFKWLPAVLLGQPDISWRSFTDNVDSLFGTSIAAAVSVDMKDLFLYGDQFLSMDPATTGINGMAVEGTGTKVPVQANVDALFASADATDGVRQDGIVRLSILGLQQDTSPRGSVLGGPA